MRHRQSQVYMSVLLLVIVAGAVSAVGVLRSSPSQPVTSGCAWPVALNQVTLTENSQLNVGNPDTADDYWIMPVPVEDGLRVTLSGEYPHSRYMSIAVYNAHGTPFTTNGVSSTLTDYRIAPDPGSVNPWQHQAPPGGRFTVTLRSNVAPAQVNTLPVAPARTPNGNTDVIFYRVYAAPGGPEQVPLPSITITHNGKSTQLPQCPASSQQRIPKSYCSILWVNKESPVCGATHGAATPGEDGTIIPFAKNPVGEGGTPDNDIAYLSASIVPRRNAGVVVVRAKVPTTPSGNAPAPWPQRGTDLRYWSLCIDLAQPSIPVVVNRLSNGTVDYGCRHDNQIPIDRKGYYTFVIGTESQRATIERIPGTTFLPFSATNPTQPYELNLRNMLPEGHFRQAIQNVPANGRSASAAAAMGPYYPRIAFCPLATLAAGGPSACMLAAVPLSNNANETATSTTSTRLIETLLFVCVLVGWAILETWQGLKRRGKSSPAAQPGDRGSRLIMFFYGVVAVAIAIWVAAKAPEASTPGGVITFGIGLCVMCGGLVLRWRSFKALGRYVTVPVITSPDQLLITTGPYRFVRHPSYLGLILVLAGIGVILANWFSIAVLALVPLIGVMYRTHIEEDALPGILGDAYTGYASTRKRLVPFVW